MADMTLDEMRLKLDELHGEWTACKEAGDEEGRLVVEDELARLNGQIEIALGLGGGDGQ